MAQASAPLASRTTRATGPPAHAPGGPQTRLGRAGGLVLLALLAVLAGGGAFTAARLIAPLPHPVASIHVTAAWEPAPGRAQPPAAPPRGSLALDVTTASTREAARFAADAVSPIASVAKTMTALVVLEQHPLAAADPGPVITMTALDQADYRRIAAGGGSVAPVQTGERISERDLLLGLMLPSANNMALTLARWVDGTVPAFVARLNARARALGMTRTHFADPDGLDPATTSTAADLVLLGTAAVASPSLMSITSTTAATLPDGTAISNLDTLLSSVPGWLGIKTGWTPAAGGCLLFAARRTLAPGTAPITVVGAILGQPPDAASDRLHPELGSALHAAAAAAESAFAGYAVVDLVAATLPVSGTVRSAAGVSLTAVHATGAEHVLVLPLGDSLTASVSTTGLSTPLAAAAPVGSVTVAHDGVAVATWQLVTDTAVPDPSALSRLLHW